MTVTPTDRQPAGERLPARALVVFESMFGNTQTIAQAIADGLAQAMDVEVVEVGAAPTKIHATVALLVVGAPTHAFGLSRPTTRREATGQAQGRLVSERTGLREWLDALPRATIQIPAAAFDTRISKPRVPGSAARAAAKRLRRLGFHLVEPAQSFSVGDTTGPLVDGEIERARQWGERLAVVSGVDVDLHPSRRGSW